MKKILATAATLLLAFGSVALSTNVAAADDAAATTPAVVETAAVETIAPEQSEPAPVEAAPAVEAAAQAVVAEIVEAAPVVEQEPAVEQEPVVVEESPAPAESASRVATVATLDANVGIIGTLYPNTPDSNKESYWEDFGPHDDAKCYKHEGDGGAHGTVTNDGKTVVLKPYGADWPGDHWELLVVKAGNLDAVTIHPVAGVEYAAPDYKEVSHWIVCKGTTPEQPAVASADVEVKPATCDADGYVVGVNPVNATFGEPTYLAGQYTIVATATGDAQFEAGPGVSDDGTTKTFTGPYEPKLTGEECDPPSECDEGDTDEIIAVDPCLASAAVSFGEPTCFAYGALIKGATEHATFGEAVIVGDQYEIVATADEGYHFAPGEGVSDDGSTKTFSGTLPAKLTGDDCEFPDLDLVEPTIEFTQPTCAANGTYTVGGADVQWSRDGQPIENGKYALASGVEIELTVAPKPPHGFANDQQRSWEVSFKAPSGPCDLTTLALTGGGADHTAPLAVAGFAVLLGLAAVLRARRTTAVR